MTCWPFNCWPNNIFVSPNSSSYWSSSTAHDHTKLRTVLKRFFENLFLASGPFDHLCRQSVVSNKLYPSRSWGYVHRAKCRKYNAAQSALWRKLFKCIVRKSSSGTCCSYWGWTHRCMWSFRLQGIEEMGIILFHESHLQDSLSVSPYPWFKEGDK